MVGMLRRPQRRSAARAEPISALQSILARYLAGGRPATVAGSGGGGKNADGVLGGGQSGCNWQTGTVRAGLEGDFDYFRSNPQFNNNTNTLANGNAFAIGQSLTTNYLATVRPRIGIAADRNLAYITGGAAFTSMQLHRELHRCRRPPGAAPRPLEDPRRLGRGRRLGICLCRPLDGPGRISVRGLSDDERDWRDYRPWRHQQHAAWFHGSGDPARSRRRELQVLIAASPPCSNPSIVSTSSPACARAVFRPRRGAQIQR